MEKLNILVVEDEAILAMDLKRIITKIGYNVMKVIRYGEEAIEYVNNCETPPDLILMDVVLAGSMNGTQTAGEIQKKKNIPVIYITAYSDDHIVMNARQTNPFGYILKPFDERTLRIAIELALNKHKLEISLAESEKKHKELNRAKDKFFSLISHDLRNPFNSLLGFIEILRNQYDALNDSDRLLFINIVHNSAKNIYDQLNDLLEYSGFKSGMIECKPGRVNVLNLISRTADIHQENALKKSIRISVDVPENLFVFAGEEMLFSVFHNLISNSVKFTRKGGCIDVTASSNGNFVECTVRDNGTGMEQKVISNLFKPEMKQSTPGTENEPGTGLGLLIVKEFLEKNGGTVSVSSSPGNGTSFHLKIPKAMEIS